MRFVGDPVYAYIGTPTPEPIFLKSVDSSTASLKLLPGDMKPQDSTMSSEQKRVGSHITHFVRMIVTYGIMALTLSA